MRESSSSRLLIPEMTCEYVYENVWKGSPILDSLGQLLFKENPCIVRIINCLIYINSVETYMLNFLKANVYT